MKILSVNQIRQADQNTISNEPIESIDLMERAAIQLEKWIVERFSTDNRFKIFAGPGNNGGDGLALARLLAEGGYKVEVFMPYISDSLSQDCQINLNRLTEQGKIQVQNLDEHDYLPELSPDDVVVDALFGSGLNRVSEGFVVQVIQHINASGATIISIDIPSGLFSEDNLSNLPEGIVQADYTLSFEFPKLAFFFHENYEYVGEWFVLPIHLIIDFIDDSEINYYYCSGWELSRKLIKRKRFDHKGKFGHAFLISGSYGKIGAAVLAARACLRAGVGLLTVHIPRFGYEIIQTAIPEAMTSIDKYDKVISKIPSMENYSAVGIGPGIGRSRQATFALKDLLEKATAPLIIDADAINIISENREMIQFIPQNSILTPHPKEFERLVGKSDGDFDRLQRQIQFSKENNVVVVLKGAFTSVSSTEGKVYFNTTGNPGMAKGGCGDVLTGIILALYAQNYSPYEAAILGVFLHGLAADLAIQETSQEALLSSDIINYLGKAFTALKKM
ncbi:MAG: NAD(P)H-hydrate dehydratase [Bacteroidales bacterium]|nr:NAD(P)H-hydrate dehydratase [Bacteroidales bacterium]MCF8455940.1 NAD(P)H-hydrate dehydratase [Bacteroidales bacterium]